MYLTRKEEKIYDGEFGWAYQTAMKILVRLGDLFGASKLIPIKSAHISGVSYKTLGDAPIDFLKATAETCPRVRVPSTLNPCGFDSDYLAAKFSERLREKQTLILNLYTQMGVVPTLTCTPYYLKPPKPGWHLASAESSAVVYTNSVLSAWTNREGSPSALAAALIGKVPDYGVHQPENRQPSIIVKVETELTNEAEFGALGVYVGKTIKDKVPVFQGLPANVTSEELKQLGAGLASSGMTSIFHYKPRQIRGLERVSVTKSDVRNVMENLSAGAGSPDLVFVGCPHCSLGEVKAVAELLKGKRVCREFWVCTSRFVKEKATEHVKVIEKAGGHVLCDTCAIVTWLKELGVRIMLTNSAKAAYYSPTMNNVDAVLAPLNECVETALKPQR
ncbi:MAG: aconitase X catalytic domain-containing protein [Candidatus Bathyarchaeia archaeon]